MKKITVKFISMLVFSFLLTSCFKVGYVLELGSQKVDKEKKSGYYYKNPTYHIK
jgi:hypothetical protein